jgi:tetratricopeptide (TPR) repeat protein
MGKKYKKNKRTLSKNSSDALLKYLGNYGEPELTQPAEEALFDTQIKNLSLPLTEAISTHTTGTILDVGCGDGILLNRLVSISDFINSKWSYLGIDYEEKTSGVLQIAIKAKIHRRIETLNLDQFYSNWPTEDIATKPYIVIVRNVFHELDIDATTTLLCHLANNLQVPDMLLIQDLLVFPDSERGNVCWTLNNFNRLLKNIGFSTTQTDEITPKGNRWFSIIAKRDNSQRQTNDAIKKCVLYERKKQYEYWNNLGWLVSDDDKYRDVKLAKIDFDLQCAALHQQLMKSPEGIVQQLTSQQQAQITKKTFIKQLSFFNPETAFKFIKQVEEPKCENRRNHQDWLENFLRDENASVAVLAGGQLIGKTTLVQKVLSGRAYEKKVVMIDIYFTSSVWNLIEHFLSEIGCHVSYELLKSLKNFSFEDIRDELRHFITNFSDRVIIVIDHFERLLNSNGDISDKEIRDLLSIIAEVEHAKLIITSRRKPNLHFIASEKLSKPAPPIGRLPEVPDRAHIYVEHILDNYNDRAKLGIVNYPVELLKAIDNHPHLAVLVALIIRKKGKDSLGDTDFLISVQNQLREELLQRIVDDQSRPILEILSLVRIPVPRNMLESLTSKDCVHTAEEDCLIYKVFDNLRDDLFTIIGPFKKQNRDDEFESFEDFENKEDKEIGLHKKVAHWYAQLYNSDKDPRWLRELYYHTIAAGDANLIEEFGLAYKSEIFFAGDYWFRYLKKYNEALWAFETVHKLGLKTDFTEMRLAACLMRVYKPEKVKEGEILYQDLILRNPNWLGIKTSYIDSLLYLKRYKDALDKLVEYRLPDDDDHWIIHEYGKAYLGLHRYKEAINAFERQLKIDTDAFVFDILARAYHKIGEAEHVNRILKNGLNRHKTNRRLKLTYAAYLVRIGNTESLKEAEPILKELYNSFPTDGRIFQQYCKLLCQTMRVDEAEQFWNLQKDKISPLEYRTPIHITILIGKKNWPAAIDKLKDISLSDEHLVGMKKKVYLTWARSEKEKSEQQRIAQEGLNVNMEPSLENNIPLMVTSARLARLAGNDEQYSVILKKVGHINASIANMLSHEDEALSYLEEDIF